MPKLPAYPKKNGRKKKSAQTDASAVPEIASDEKIGAPDEPDAPAETTDSAEIFAATAAPEAVPAGTTDATDATAATDANAGDDEALENLELCTDVETTRVGRWKNRLLDLSLKNSQLKFDRRGAGAGLNLAVHDVAVFEDILSTKTASFAIFAPEELTAARDIETDFSVHETAAAALADAAARVFPRRRLIALPPTVAKSNPANGAERVQARLARIARDAKKAMDETGANTLYIALGFLHWPCEKRRNAIFRAPLVLIPAKLERGRNETRFSVCARDEDVRLNLTLAELLRQEFGITLPELENSLPEDESGIDVPAVFKIFETAVAGRTGFHVEKTCAIGNFSFAKYLMWRDLQERTDALARSRIVAHLIDETRAPFESDEIAFPNPAELDETVPVKEIFCPLSADSSQLSAICAAASGKNFILVGPPGTGKSQTITNMIANALAAGKTVLFVAEKAAALNVVFNRLKKIGLGPFCLELHSDKTDKREVYRQFASTLDVVSAGASVGAEARHEKFSADAQALRDKLLHSAKALHSRRKNGLTLAEAVGVACENENVPEIEIVFKTGTPLDDTENAREHRLAAADALAETFRDAHEPLSRAAGTIAVTQWTPQWQSDAAQAVAEFKTKAKTLGKRSAAWTTATGLIPTAGTVASLRKLTLAARKILTVRGASAALVFGGDEAEKTLRKLHDAAALAEICAKHKAMLSLPYAENASEDARLESLLKTWNEADSAWAIPRLFKRRKVVKALRSLVAPNAGTTDKKISPADPRVDLGNLIAIHASKKEFSEKYASLETEFPTLVRGVEPCGAVERLAEIRNAREAIRAALSDLESVPEKQDAWRSVFARWLDANDAAGAPDGNVAQALDAAEKALEEFAAAGIALRKIFDAASAAVPAEAKETPDSAVAFADELEADIESWRDVCAWNAAATAAGNLGLSALATAVRDGTVPAESARKTVEVNYCRRFADAALAADAELSASTAGKNGNLLNKFRSADNTVRHSCEETARARLVDRARAVFNADAAEELKFLRHEINKRSRFLPIRRFLAHAPKMQRLLKPCMLTSPLSAAQYLDATAEPFDIVIFDEASQISVWDAVGALARGKSAVVVGDPKQLPPTGFFQRANAASDAGTAAESDVFVPEDAESVLDECKACGVPAMNLTWHYRSRAESLIAFSNAHYYNGELSTFPAPRVRDRAVECVFCGNGNYSGGTNPAEAKALVERVVSELSRPGFVWNELTSVGIVTFNAQQQMLIQKLLAVAQEGNPGIREFFSEDAVAEPLFVKNLENVQGDERGVIYFSTTFGPDARGNVSQNFGPINRVGGERRLNVAITRARAGMRVFTSLRPSDIHTERGGMADFREFLEFARSGTLVAAKATNANAGTTAAHGAENAIAADLEKLGWKCRRNVGISGIRVDIAVIHPDNEEEFLAGILCDGAASMNAPTVRDREILREDVLRGLGWNLLRAWIVLRRQTPKRCISQLDTQLRALLASSQQQQRNAEANEMNPPNETAAGAPNAAAETPETAVAETPAGTAER